MADDNEVADSLDDLIAWAALPRPRWMRDGLCREPAYASWNWFPDDRSARAAHLEQLRGLCGKCLCASSAGGTGTRSRPPAASGAVPRPPSSGPSGVARRRSGLVPGAVLRRRVSALGCSGEGLIGGSGPTDDHERKRAKMRLRIAAVLSVALFAASWLPGAAVGHHKDTHPPEEAEVSGKTVDDGDYSPADDGDHVFDPDNITVRPGARVKFTNEEPVVPPHTWTVISGTCNPHVGLEGCNYDTGVVPAGGEASVDLTGLPPGTYPFICRIGQPENQGFLTFPSHATYDTVTKTWTGMVGTLVIKKPGGAADG